MIRPTIAIRIRLSTWRKLKRLVKPGRNETMANYLERVSDILEDISTLSK